jgi:putative ABC transport system permease protein
LGDRRMVLLLLGVFAGVALLLATVGIYGVIAYSVAQRTQEIGIRMALGAQREDVLKLIVGQGFRLALVGVGLGVAGAVLFARFVRSLLFHVKATDPATFAAVAIVFVAVALGASFVPAWRATKVDPMEALRHE